MKNENPLTNNFMYGGKFIPSGDKMIAAVQTPVIRKPAVLPDYARFKLVLEYSNTGKRIWYPSLEFSNLNNITEEKAYHDLRTRISARKNPEAYNFITVWMSFSDKLNWRKDRTYDFECYTVRAGQNFTTERTPIFFLNGKVNLWETKCKYKLPEAMVTIQDQEQQEKAFHRAKIIQETSQRMLQELSQHTRKNKI